MIFLLAYLNVHYLILLSMVHEYAYFYEYIWKIVYCLSVNVLLSNISYRLFDICCLWCV